MKPTFNEETKVINELLEHSLNYAQSLRNELDIKQLARFQHDVSMVIKALHSMFVLHLERISFQQYKILQCISLLSEKTHNL